MKPIVIEIVARIVDGHVDPEPLVRTTITDPKQADVAVARLLRSLADEIDRQRRTDPRVLGVLLPGVADQLTQHQTGGAA